jgi:hypothetical protein
MRVGSDAMYSSGGYSFGLKHLLPSKAFVAHRQLLEQQIHRIASDPRLSEDEKTKRIIATTQAGQADITSKVFKEALDEKNPLAMQIHSGAKGKPFNLMSLVGSDGLYVDHRDRHIPIPITRNYSEGLTPGEYWAGAYGARKGIVDLKTATQDAGYFSKQLTQAAHRLVVTAQDHDEKLHDAESPRGYPTDIDDDDNDGAFLAQDVGPYKRNTILNSKIRAHLRQLGKDRILVRSPSVGGPADGGVYAKDVGIRERGTLSPIGDFVGIGAAQSISEPLAQAQIGCLAVDTLVKMADYTDKKIQDIVIGDTVLGSDHDGFTFPVKVINVFYKGIAPCQETQFFRRRNTTLTLRSTPDHKMLSIIYRNPSRDPSKPRSYAQVKQRPVGTRVKRYTAVLPSGILDDSHLEDGDTNRFTKDYVLEMLRSSIPEEWIATKNNAFFKALLLAMFKASGSIKKYKKKTVMIKLSSSSTKALQQVSDILLFRFGIITSQVQSYEPRNKIDIHCIQITHPKQQLSFMDQIGYVDPKYRELGIIALSDIDMLPDMTKHNRIMRKKITMTDPCEMFDIEVDHPDHMFVLSNGLIVSNSKHTGGVAGAGAGVSGFKAINQLVQVPKVFPGGAIHSQVDGKVQKIVDAPGGGYHVMVNDKPHYVPVGLEVKAKPGDVIEAGDMLTNGLPNPAEIVTHKSIGEGRKAFIDAFKSAAKDAGFNLHRRNVELVARGLINHVVLKENMGDYMIDDVVPYNTVENEYQPRPGHRVAKPGDAVNSYLERPVLHYSIGTKVRPSVVEQLKKYNVGRVTVHNDPAPFEPEMIRGMANLSNDPDWMTRMLGSNLERGLLQSVHRGGSSNELGTSYVPSLARGVDFGKKSPVKGYNPAELVANKQTFKPMDPSSLVAGS